MGLSVLKTFWPSRIHHVASSLRWKPTYHLREAFLDLPSSVISVPSSFPASPSQFHFISSTYPEPKLSYWQECPRQCLEYGRWWKIIYWIKEGLYSGTLNVHPISSHTDKWTNREDKRNWISNSRTAAVSFHTVSSVPKKMEGEGNQRYHSPT